MAEGFASGGARELSQRWLGCEWQSLSLVALGGVDGGERLANEAIHGGELKVIKTRHLVNGALGRSTLGKMMTVRRGMELE